ncbi:MAG: DegQ family serine endoprotease [Candidatus Abyssubacteria bacterium]
MMSKRATLYLSVILAAMLLWAPAHSWAAEKAPLHEIERAFVQIAENATPSVVHLTTERMPLKGLKEKMDEEEFFKIFPFPHIDPDEFRALAAGSGLIMSEDGYILTNNHLVENSGEITVKISGSNGDRGKTYEGRVVGRDPATDLAVIKIDPQKPLPAAKLGDSSTLKVGQWAIAIGDPFGFEKTVTVGVISGIARSGFMGPLRDVRYQDFIQTDASINPGNSGGPLLNVNGEVIGINTFIQSAGSGIGFAIPINMAREVYEQLKEHGEVIRGFLGVQIGDLTEGLAAALKAPDLYGALVMEVIPDTPAQKAGLRHGDVIRNVDGTEIEDSKMLQNIISHKKPGDKIELLVLRQGEKKKFTVELIQFQEQIVASKQPEEELNLLGLQVQSIEDEKGVVISDIEPGGAADKGGLIVGDIILELNMEEVNSPQEFKKIVSELSPGEWLSFYIKRDNQTFYKAVKIPSKTK